MRRLISAAGRRAALPVVCAAIAGPVAADWSATLTLSQRAEANSNIRLEDTPDRAVRTISSARLNTRYTSDRINWNTTLGVSGVATIGEDPGTISDRVNPNITSGFSYRGKRLGLTGDVSIRRRQASTAQFEDNGFTEVDAAQFDFNNDLGLTYQIDPRSSLRLGASVDVRRFTGEDEAFTESETFGVSTGYNFRLSPRTRLSAGGGLRFFFADNAADTESQVVTLSAGVSHDVNARLSVSANAGVDFDRRRATTNGVRSTSEDIGFTGDAALSWRPDERSTLGVSASQVLNPSAFGALQRISRVSLSYSNQLTPFIGFSFGASAADRDGGGAGEGSTSRQTLSLSPSLSYQITRAWNASLGYEFRLSRDADDTVTSNAVFLQVGRSFSLIP